MEAPQLSFRIHPGSFSSAVQILNAAQIPFEFKYETVYGLVGCFIINTTKALELEAHIAAMQFTEASSSLQLSQEENKITRFYEIDRDYERIKSDMKALIFYARLNQSDNTSMRKEKVVTDMLDSNLSKTLHPKSRRNSTK